MEDQELMDYEETEAWLEADFFQWESENRD